MVLWWWLWQGLGLALSLVAALVVIYATWIFRWRLKRIGKVQNARWDNPLGPLVIGLGLILALAVEVGFYIALAAQNEA
jgi:predicted PurR-regulated permease PerM